ncbi:hypothetical protein EC9_20470 [Rosistilla ulvae]|uniref:Uncharacterized protein n=2 Tax=Rosistilla ulvae TaxID=1930277 RepID=A0A517LZ15_9BACT|nr:hypothetical protein EC9_20470 [Rosistilla ulvae]
MLAPTWSYALLVVLAGLLGWAIPWFYQWTESDQSRMSPLVGQFALALAIAGVTACCSLPWLPLRSDPAPSPTVRFQTRTLLLITTLVAIGFAGMLHFPMAISLLLCGATYLHLLWFVVRYRPYRWAAAAMLGCMDLPFAWVASDGNLIAIGQALLGLIAGLPMLLPAGFIASGLGHNFHDLAWLPVLLTVGQLFLGTWIIRLGTKPTIAYLIASLLISLFGSFCFHAMVLA